MVEGFQLFDTGLTISNSAISNGAAIAIAWSISHDDDLLVVIEEGVCQGHGRGGSRVGIGTGV